MNTCQLQYTPIHISLSATEEFYIAINSFLSNRLALICCKWGNYQRIDLITTKYARQTFKISTSEHFFSHKHRFEFDEVFSHSFLLSGPLWLLPILCYIRTLHSITWMTPWMEPHSLRLMMIRTLASIKTYKTVSYDCLDFTFLRARLVTREHQLVATAIKLFLYSQRTHNVKNVVLFLPFASNPRVIWSCDLCQDYRNLIWCIWYGTVHISWYIL